MVGPPPRGHRFLTPRTFQILKKRQQSPGSHAGIGVAIVVVSVIASKPSDSLGAWKVSTGTRIDHDPRGRRRF